MTFLKTLLLLFLIAVSVLQNWLWLALMLVGYYSLFYPPVGLVSLAILLDGYFGNFNHWPWLSILSIFWYFIAYSLRQKIVNIKEA